MATRQVISTKVLAALLAAGLAGSGCVAEDIAEPEGDLGETGKAGTPGPRLGAHYNASGGMDFRVYSSRATRIEVHLFTQSFGADAVGSFVMTKNATTSIWSVAVSATQLANLGFGGHVYYGYRAWGPNWPFNPAWTKGSQVGFITDVDAQGNRFNPNKLLSDPYALELSHDPGSTLNPDDTIYASGPQFRGIDNARKATKSVAFPEDNTSFGTKPTRAFKDDVVYEVHVRGLTMQDSSIPAQYRGTYRGAGMKAASLAALGVTAVELLPIHETLNDINDVTPNSTSGDNYWGYMTINFFAPDRRYSSDKTPGGPTREFKQMVKAFHDAGVKVYVDVVYNHTAEGGPFSASDPSTAKLFNYRGLDNPTYYSLTSDMKFNYDNTGVGGNFNTFNPIAQNLIVDSLLYWRDEMGLDGYRFDLASVLGNTCQHGCFNYDKLNPGTALNRIWNDLSPRPANGGAGVDLIAEPWAIGGNSYQVGNFPSGWIEWGAAFRDTLRKDQNMLGSENVTPGNLATRFAGSADMFGDDGRRPWNSVNFMVAHDGFTLADLFGCNSKNNNQAWPYGPSDGGEDHNNSWDQGGNLAGQRKAARNAMAFMALSAGVPMFNGGDEFLRSQRCNNNAYNLDSEGNWLNYSLSTQQQNFKTYTQRLLAFRKAHPALRPSNFYSASDNNGNVMEQLRWFKPDGAQADAAYFDNPNNHAIAWRIDGTELGDTAKAIYIAYNGWQGPVNFTLPWTGQQATSWYRVTDTCEWAEGGNQVRQPGSEDFIGGEGTVYGLCERGVLLLVAK
jgi:isoamylase